VRWTRLALHVASSFFTLRFLWPRADGARRHEMAVRWAQDLLAILAIRVRCEGRPPPHARTGAMIASNHVSWADIFAIASLRHTRFIAKSEIRDWPLAGWLAESSGTIFIRRARRHDTARINALVHDALAGGDCVGLFPEGTTTQGDRLLKFHSSLFEPAVANRARVYPVAVRYENPDGTPLVSAAYVGDLSFAQSLGLVIRTRETVARVRFAHPIEPDGLSRQEVALEAHRRVAELLGLPAVTSTGTRAGRTA
jgi:1-acyl-sn-glycerol-3-phosphate acyltransferase